MRLALSRWVAACGVFFASSALAAADTTGEMKLSGPAVHENLAVYFIRGASNAGSVPLSLEEAMAHGFVQVHETGRVNQLEIENSSDKEVFVQAGDIVKGGQQDRTLMVSLVLPPKSGRMQIASFCVEQGRWSARGREDVKRFSSSAGSLPSREMKLAMMAPAPAAPRVDGVAPAPSVAETSKRQKAVWDGVKAAQDRLSRNIGQPVTAASSESSLQLALENEKLLAAQEAYVRELKSAGDSADDIVGFVIVVNGRISSGDVYASNGLFRKMWPKLLKAGAIEAIGKKDESRADMPSVRDVLAFLASGERGAASERPITEGVRLQTRESDQAFLFETSRGGNWVYRNYLAK